jgi:hypothetical protein
MADVGNSPARVLIGLLQKEALEFDDIYSGLNNMAIAQRIGLPSHVRPSAYEEIATPKIRGTAERLPSLIDAACRSYVSMLFDRLCPYGQAEDAWRDMEIIWRIMPEIGVHRDEESGLVSVMVYSRLAIAEKRAEAA